MEKYYKNEIFATLIQECTSDTIFYINSILKTQVFDNFPIFKTPKELYQVFI